MMIIVYLNIKYKFLLSVLLGILLSFADEYHQTYSLYRTPKIGDVGIDTIGIFTGTLCAWILVVSIKRLFIRREINS